MSDLKKILVVEDDPFLRKVYESKFSKAGYEIKVAKDGSEVADVLKDFTPDIILLDLIMPRKDGFTTLKELKENDAWKSIPVVVTSNLGQAEDKKRASDLGASSYVVKSELPIQKIIDLIESKLSK